MFSFTLITIHYRKKHTYIQYCEKLITDSVKYEFLPHFSVLLERKKSKSAMQAPSVSHNSAEYILAFLLKSNLKFKSQSNVLLGPHSSAIKMS